MPTLKQTAASSFIALGKAIASLGQAASPLYKPYNQATVALVAWEQALPNKGEVGEPTVGSSPEAEPQEPSSEEPQAPTQEPPKLSLRETSREDAPSAHRDETLPVFSYEEEDEAPHGADYSLLTETVDPGFYGTIKAVTEWMSSLVAKGGVVSNKVFKGTAQSCLGGPMNQALPDLSIRNCVFEPIQQFDPKVGSKVGKAWFTRGLGQAREYIDCTFDGAKHGPFEGHAEGHVYDNPGKFWKAIRCLFNRLPGNVQITCRPYEAPGLCEEVDVEATWRNCHAFLKPEPGQEPKQSAMKGSLFQMYNLGPKCDAFVDQYIIQDEVAPFGGMFVCVPAMSAAEEKHENGAKAWWEDKIGQHLHDSVSIHTVYKGKRPTASELCRVAALRELDWTGNIDVTDLNESPCRIMLDDPQHFAGHAKLEHCRIDLKTTINGKPWKCPIERNGAVVAFTTDGVYEF